MFGPLDVFARDVAGRWSTYLTGVVALGLLSFAILQTVKDLSPVRRAFQKWFLRKWFASKCATADVSVLEDKLIALATDGDVNAFYDLPIEQLCGQISAAAQVVIENPGAKEQLLRCLAAKAPEDALGLLTAEKQPLHLAFGRLKQQGVNGEPALQALADAKSRVMHQVQRSLDGLQISASYRWKFYFQIASFVITFLLAVAASNGSNWPHRMFVGVVAGFLAPVARDLQSRLQQVK